MIRVAIFDDNKNIRNSLALLLTTDEEIQVVGAYGDASRCVTDILFCQPDIVLMDIEMPGVGGIEAVRKIKTELPHIEVLMQTVYEDDELILQSILAGASGYVLKTHIDKSLITSVKQLQSGGSPLSPSIARRVVNMVQNNPAPKNTAKEYGLTPKETEVLTFLVNGLSYKMIASELFITYETVRSHMKNIYAKLHVASMTEVVAKAITNNIV